MIKTLLAQHEGAPKELKTHAFIKGDGGWSKVHAGERNSNLYSEAHMINESFINLADVDDDILNYEVADEAVEAAAGVLEGQTKSAPTFWPCVTISFCNDAHW